MADSETKSGDVFDLDRIQELIELMKEHGLTEIDLCQDDQQIRLCRGGGSAPVVQQVAAPAMAAAPAAPTAAAEAPADDANITYIRSQGVGTFYSRANPNAEPFVKVGDHVAPETTVCIVEAMKTFTEIPAECSGCIVAVLVEDEEPVDVGKPLFKVDTSK